MIEVIDASVALKWFLNEPGREEALDVLARAIAAPEQVCVPELFYFEIAHVFNKLIPAPTPVQRTLLQKISVFGFKRFVCSPELLDWIAMYQSRGLSGYDAAYVAVATIVGGVWLTFDAKAFKRLDDKKLCRLLKAGGGS